ncbi:hypothetical protein BDV11DRAFT_212670 [Aspergillus similis]
MSLSTSCQLPRTVDGAETPAVWGIGWRCPTLMTGLVTCGAMLSVGHHFYYCSFNNTFVHSGEQQVWAIRIGTGFAFLVKSCLVSAVGVAAVQETWATLHRKSVKLSGIDGMFAVLNDPLAFLTSDIWIYAKTLTVLAIVSWLIPLTAIITPSTLYVITKPVQQPSKLDFQVSTEGAGYITSPLPKVSRLFTVTASSMRVIPAPAPFPNLSYMLTFWNPLYKCQSLSKALLDVHGLSQAVWDNKIRNTVNWPLSVYSRNNNASQPTKLVCWIWNTSYMVSLSFNNGVQTLTPKSVDHVAYSKGPTGTAGFYVVHMLFSGLIQGDWHTGASGSVAENITLQTAFTRLSITQTSLLACLEINDSSTSCQKRMLARVIKDLLHNFTYSLLSLNAANATVNVMDLTSRNFYLYSKAYLILAYTTTLGVTVACMIVGFFALRQNSISQSTSFLSVLITTRNPELDRLAVGHCLGAEPLKKEIRKVQLQYGEIKGPDQRYQHAAFGTEGLVTALSKGENYY